MTQFGIKEIKSLREMLGSGMADTKKALEEADGNMEKAIEILRLKGAKGNAKRALRSAAEGLVLAESTSTHALILELNCETDFVAKGEKFISLAQSILRAGLNSGASTLQELLSADVDGETAASRIEQLAAVIGEKFELRRVKQLKGAAFDIYMHQTSKDLPPQVGVVVAYSGSDKDVAHSIAQHIAFAAPEYLSREDVPAERVEAERRIVEEITRQEGKPEAALPKIVEGRLNAFYKQVVLLEQEYSRDPKFSISQIAQNAGLTLLDFARFKVGEGVDLSEPN